MCSEVVELLVTTISHITIMVGRFPKDLHPYFAQGLAHRFLVTPKKYINKLDSPLEMTNELSKLVNKCENNMNNLSIVDSVDPNYYKINNIMSDYFVQNQINKQIIIGYLRFGS